MLTTLFVLIDNYRVSKCIYILISHVLCRIASTVPASVLIPPVTRQMIVTEIERETQTEREGERELEREGEIL